MPEPTIGRETLPKVWIYICKFWIFIVATGAIVMVTAVWFMILIQNIAIFQSVMGTYLGNDELRYPPGDPSNGYVNNTNIPKHLGGAVFAAVFDISMILFCAISLCSDIFWRIGFCRQILDMLFCIGLWSDKKFVDIEFFFLIANAFLKLFIVAATGAQAYTGIEPHNVYIDNSLFCLYAVLILLGSILPTIIAGFFIIHRSKRAEHLKEVSKA